MIIYMITNDVNGKRYIGQTRRTLAERKSGHKRAMLDGADTYLYNAMRKYGFDSFSWKVIDSSAKTPEQLNELETKYIKQFDTVNNGYNMYYGGDSNSMDSEEVKEKHDTKMRTSEVRAKISETLKEYRAETPFSEEHKQHISQGLHRFYAQGNKPKYRVPQHLSEEHKQLLIESRNKKVTCSGEGFSKSFNSIKEASKWLNDELNLDISYKHNAAKIKKSAENGNLYRGFKWCYNSCVETIEKQGNLN